MIEILGDSSYDITMKAIKTSYRCGFVVLVMSILGGWQCGKSNSSSGSVSTLKAVVKQSFPHSESAFTQGLVAKDGYLYESTGRRGQSFLRKLEMQTGRVLKSTALDGRYFGEGLTLFNNEWVYLTWQARTGFIFAETDDSFAYKSEFSYPTEGWGITTDGNHLIMSDGSDKLYFLNAYSKVVEKTVNVTFDGKSLDKLNELEYFDGKIWANVWQEEFFVAIDPASGVVKTKVVVDFEDLFSDGELAKFDPNEAVLNGIAYDAKTSKIYITGKLWPKIFEVELR